MEKSPLQPAPLGAFRFNTDSSKLEYYDGNQWVNITSDSPEAQTGGTRGVFVGNWNPAPLNTIDYINVSTTGNAVDFGDANQNYYMVTGVASRTRGIYHGYEGSPAARNDRIEYITISSTGNGTDFSGDFSVIWQSSGASCSDQTRSLWSLGMQGPSSAQSNIIEYVNIATTGRNSNDFGDLTRVTSQQSGSFSSPTRGIFSGGPNPDGDNVIDYVTISTLGNAADFGDTIDARKEGGGASNCTRGLFMSCSGPGDNNAVTYITISTLGNSVDFGDLNNSAELGAGLCSPTRAVLGGGTTPSKINNIDYHQIATTGNFIDFGDRTVSGYGAAGLSNGHGGLG